MNLGQMRLEVRRAIAELAADLWSDSEINDWLNEGAKIMVSNAQNIQAMHQFTTVAGTQEYSLPDDIDELFAATYYNNGIIQLAPADARNIQQGTNFTGISRWFYTRTSTAQTSGQGASGITLGTVDAANPRLPHLVLGLYPIPAAATQVTVFYYSRHYTMRTDGSVPAVPPEFRRGIIAYATALAKEKEMAYGEADRKRKEFQEFADRLREKMVTDCQDIAFPTVRTDDDQVPYGDIIIKFGTAT